MAKTGGAVQKLIEKRKRKMMAHAFGTCQRHTPRGFNGGVQFGIIDKAVDGTIKEGKVVTSDAERTGVYRKFKKRSFNKWAKYGV